MTCAHKCIRQVKVRNLFVIGLGFKRKEQSQPDTVPTFPEPIS